MIGNRFEDNWGPASYGLLLKEIKDSRVERNILSRQHAPASTPRDPIVS